jgi:hypothetical protein
MKPYEAGKAEKIPFREDLVNLNGRDAVSTLAEV